MPSATTPKIRRVAAKRHFPANHVEENAAKAPDVGSYRDFLSSKNQLWCKIRVRMQTPLNLIELSLVPVRRKTKLSDPLVPCPRKNQEYDVGQMPVTRWQESMRSAFPSPGRED